MTHWLYLALMVGPTASVLVRVARHPHERGAWGVLGSGLALWTAGYVWQMVVDLRGQHLPFPSGADALWVSSYPVMLTGLGLLVRRRLRRPGLGLAMSGLTLALVLVAVVTAPLLPIVQGNASGLSLPAQIASFYYPVVDTVLAAAVVTVLLLVGLRAGRTWLLLAVGAVPLSAGDVLWTVHLSEGTWHSLMWSNWLFTLWPVFAALAAWQRPSGTVTSTVDGGSVRVLIAVQAASLAAIALLVTDRWIEAPTSSIVLAALGLLAAVERIWSALANGLRASRAAAHGHAVVEDVRTALERGELELHFQPLVDASSDAVTGAEALLRWRRDGALVPPDSFLPAVERSALMGPLTDFVVDRALTELARWRADGHDLGVSVNLAAANLGELTLSWRVAQALRRHGIPADALTLELTETAAVDDPDIAARVLADLDAIGVNLSLDDFGTGHSSLARLAQTPLDELKIDRSFASDMTVTDRRIVAAMIELAHALGLRVVAEGVETTETLEMLRALGCDVIQGWLVARAMTGQELSAWLAERDAPTSRATRAAGT